MGVNPQPPRSKRSLKPPPPQSPPQRRDLEMSHEGITRLKPKPAPVKEWKCVYCNTLNRDGIRCTECGAGLLGNGLDRTIKPDPRLSDIVQK